MERQQQMHEIVARFVSWSTSRDVPLLRALGLLELVREARATNPGIPGHLLGTTGEPRCVLHPHLSLRCSGCIGATGGRVSSPKKARAARRNGKKAVRA